MSNVYLISLWMLNSIVSRFYLIITGKLYRAVAVKLLKMCKLLQGFYQVNPTVLCSVCVGVLCVLQCRYS